MPGAMRSGMSEAIGQCLLGDYGLLRFAGRDALTFLQGQLSNDMGRARADRPLLAGLHAPQGRTLALLRLWKLATDTAPPEVIAALPAELLATVETHLRRFVLRSKVSIAADDAYRVWGQRLTTGAPPQLLLQPRDWVPAAAALSREEWEALEIEAGIPEVRATTSGEFIAQMLNLDCVDAVAWDKGCYTGQEIIARAHYRGHVKRRMRRFIGHSDLLPGPGDHWNTSEGRHARVVRAARRAGGVQLLAVMPLEESSADERPLPYALPAQYPGGGQAQPP
jgi:folate-binding protein YgfZ